MTIYQFFKNDPDYYYMVLENMAGGELFDRIVQKVGNITERERKGNGSMTAGLPSRYSFPSHRLRVGGGMERERGSSCDLREDIKLGFGRWGWGVGFGLRNSPLYFIN